MATAARIALLMFLALKTVNQPQPQPIVNPQGLSICPDSVNRDAVFAQLNDAMTGEGFGPADILRESAALEAAVSSGEGFIEKDDNGAYIFNPIDDNANPKFNFSEEEQKTMYRKFLEIFQQIKDCFGGMNLWEQLNALLLASGAVTFATQCIMLGTAVASCTLKIFHNVKEFSFGSLKRINNFLITVPSAAVPPAEDARKIVSDELNNIIVKIEKKYSDKKYSDKKYIGKNIYKNKVKNLINEKDLINVSVLSIKTLEAIKEAKKKWNEAIRIRRFSTNTSPTIKAGSKRRRNNKTKSKTKSKRRRYKTKKRAYRSSRFASRK